VTNETENDLKGGQAPTLDAAADIFEAEVSASGLTPVPIPDAAVDSTGAVAQTSSTGQTGAAAQADTANPTGAVAQTEADAAQPSSGTNGDIKQTNLPPHFEPIPPEKLDRAKRTKRILIAIIIILLCSLLVMAGIAGYVYLVQQQNIQAVEKTALMMETNAERRVQDKGTAQEKEMPNLAQMFGITTDVVMAQLGSEYALVKTEAVEEADLPQAKQLSTVTYAPTEKGTVGTVQVQNIYLSLDDSGAIVGVYFVGSLDTLGYQMSSFAELTNNRLTLDKVLSSAGLAAAADFAYTAPTIEQYTQYVDPLATTKKVKKETAIFNGILRSETAPTSFSLTFTYDYGASGVADTPDKKPSQRMVYLRLI
jgi:hypothetical protein